jgi:peptidoglycan/LPS O-acetylase OafA/YrhL
MYVPIYELINDAVPLTPPGSLTVNAQFTIFNNALLAMVNAAVGVLALIAIFLYKNRNLQIRAGNLALLLDCGMIGLLFFSADATSTTIQAKVHYMYGSYLPVIIAIFLFAAVRYIKRDDALVRSADRLR